MRAGEIRQLMMNLVTQADKNGSLKLNPGQIISVLLKEIQGNTALLSYNGLDIMAKLETEVPVGEKLRCLVLGEKNNQIVLKVLNSADEETDLRFRSIINHIGLEENEANLTMVKEMMNRQMPLNHEKLRLFSAFVKNYNVTDAEAWIPVFMDSRGIPLTESAFKACRDILGNMNDLHDDITKLNAQIKNFVNEAPAGSTLGQAAQKISNMLDYLALKPGEGRGETADKLFNVFRIFVPGSGPDGQTAGKGAAPGQAAQLPDGGSLGSQIATGQKNSPEINIKTGLAPFHDTVVKGGAGNQGDIGSTGGARSAENIGSAGHAGSVGNANPSDRTNHSGNPGGAGVTGESGKNEAVAQDTGHKAQEILERFSQLFKEASPQHNKGISHPLNEIKKLLDLSLDQSQEENLPELLDKLTGLLKKDGENTHRELAGLLQSTADKLDVIKNLNQPMDGSRDQMTVIYSKVDFGSREEPVKILLNYRNKGKGSQQDFTNCSIKVSLNTIHMGCVKCEVQLSSKNMSLQFSADNEKTAGTIEKAQGILGQRLEQMNYSVKLMPCRVEKEPDYIAALPETISAPGLFQVNLTV